MLVEEMMMMRITGTCHISLKILFFRNCKHLIDQHASLMDLLFSGFVVAYI